MRWLRDLASLVCGALFPLGFAPFGFFVLPPCHSCHFLLSSCALNHPRELFCAVGYLAWECLVLGFPG